jgi:hypothetical protein
MDKVIPEIHGSLRSLAILHHARATWECWADAISSFLILVDDRGPFDIVPTKILLSQFLIKTNSGGHSVPFRLSAALPKRSELSPTKCKEGIRRFRPFSPK